MSIGQRLTLGLGSIVTDGYGATNPEGFGALLACAAEAGITHLDTAAAYGAGKSERLLGRWASDLDHDFSICTKIGLLPAEDGGFASSATPASLMRQAEASLDRLRVERVDTLLLHRPDPAVSPHRSVEGMIACREAGLATRIGISNFPSEVAVELMEEGLVDTIQYPWSLLDHRCGPLLDKAAECGVERMVFGALAYGILAGQVDENTAFEAGDWRGIARSGRDPGTNGAPFFLGDRFGEALRLARTFAKAAEVSMDSVAAATVAASLQLAPADQLIVGCRSADELHGLLGYASLRLPRSALSQGASMALM